MENIEIKNPIGMDAEALKVYATEIGVEFTEDVKFNDLRTAVFAKNKELKGDDTNTDSSDENVGGGNTEAKNVFYYWIKYPVYIDDEYRLVAGLYRVDKKFDRLSYSSDAYEVFEGEIPERTLLKIGGERGMRFGDAEDVNVKELLEKLLNPVKFK